MNRTGTGRMTVLAALALGAIAVAGGAGGCASEQQRAERAERKRVLEQQQREEKALAEQQKLDARNHKQQLARQRELDKQRRAEEARAEKAYNQKWREDGVGHEMLQADNDVRLIDRWSRAQSAAAARDDAMLSSAHFDGAGELNSLGRARLDLILDDAPAGQPVIVHVGGPRQVAQARLGSVERYVKDAPRYAGVQLQLREGANFENTFPASSGVAGLRRLEKATSSGNASLSSGDNSARRASGTTSGGNGGTTGTP